MADDRESEFGRDLDEVRSLASIGDAECPLLCLLAASLLVLRHCASARGVRAYDGCFVARAVARAVVERGFR